MKRRLLVILFSLMLCIVAVPVSADEVQDEGVEVSDEVINEEHPCRLIDEADLLSSDEEGELIGKLDAVSEEGKCDVAIVTVNSLEGKTATEFADDYYDYNGYGLGEDNDGIMLVISMGDRDWAITTCGYGITAFTDAGQEYIMDRVVPYLSSSDYVNAFNEFADRCDELIVQARDGNPYDVSKKKAFSLKGFLLWIIPCLVVGMVIALISTIKEKKNLKNVRREPGARNYSSGVNISVSTDRFVFKTLDKVMKDTGDSDGGSTTHISSSGVEHGGSSGKF